MRPRILLATIAVLCTAACDASPPSASSTPTTVAVNEPAIVANTKTFVPGSTKARYVYTPPAGVPNGKLLVYVHGGFWQQGTPSLTVGIKDLPAQGWAVVAADFRLPARHPQAEEDVAAVVKYAQRQLGVSPEDTVLYGESSGGHTAAMVAYGWNDGRSYGAPVGRVVTVSAPFAVAATAKTSWVAAQSAADGLLGCSVPGAQWLWVTACSDAFVQSAEPVSVLDGGDPPTFVAGFSGDGLVPPSVGYRAAVGALTAAGVPVGSVEGLRNLHFYSSTPLTDPEQAKVLTAVLAAINT